MIQLAAALVAVIGIGLATNYAQWQRNSALKTELSTATEALENAKAQAETLAAASRKHAAELDRLRKGANRDADAVRKASVDCADAPHGPVIGDVLRMRSGKDSAPKPAAPG